jgi:hypothetical protein
VSIRVTARLAYEFVPESPKIKPELSWDDPIDARFIPAAASHLGAL